MKNIIIISLLLLLSLESKEIIDNDGLPWIKVSNNNMSRWKPEIISKKHLRLHPRNNKKIKYKTVAIFPKKSSAYDISINKIMEVFSQKQIVSIIDVVYVAKTDKEFGREFLKNVSKNKYDLIFSVGSSATAFVYKNYKGEKTPVVSVCSKDPVLLKQMKNYTHGSGNNFAFTSLNMPITVQLNYLKGLIGEIDSIAILYAKNNKSAVKTQVSPLKELAKKENIKIFDVVVKNQKDAQNELITKMPQVIYRMNKQKVNKKKSFFWLTGSSSVLKEIKTINEYSDNIAVLSVVPNSVKEGKGSAALSIGISFESNAHLASVYGINILTKKTKVGDMKVGIVSPPDISVSFLKLGELNMKIPFDFFEIASTVYDYNGKLAKKDGKLVR